MYTLRLHSLHPVPGTGLSFERALAASMAAAAALPALGLPSRGCGVAVTDSQESDLVSLAAFLPGILAAAGTPLPFPRQACRDLPRQLLCQLLVAFAG